MSNRANPHPSPEPDWITLGHITAPFGLRGQVKLQPMTDFPERIADHQQLYLGPERRPVRLREARPHGAAILLAFEGVADMTAAESLRGLEVAIPAAEAAPLAPDQYYIHDLIGLQARHINGADLGRVADVQSNAAQDLLVVRRPGQPDVLVPLVKALIPQVDIPGGTVTIDPPAGLFDDNYEEA